MDTNFDYDAQAVAYDTAILPKDLPLEERRVIVAELEAKFKQYLRTQTEDLNDEQFEIVFERAWEFHSYGYRRIEDEVDDLYSFFHRMIRAML